MKQNVCIFLCAVGLGFLSLLFITQALAHDWHHGSAEDLVKPISGESIYNLKTKWTSMDGVDVNLSSLRGQPLVVAMGYTSCESACPIIVEDIKRIEMSLPKEARAAVTFAFFSFDSVRDTPERLRAFATMHKLDLKQWWLFQGSPTSVRELAAVLGISYKKDPQGNLDHSNIISLIDSNGVIKFQKAGLKQDSKDFLAKLIELKKPSEGTHY